LENVALRHRRSSRDPCPEKSPDAPDDQCDHCSENDERQAEDEEKPACATAHAADIAAYDGRWIATKTAAKYREISVYFCILFEAYISGKCSEVATDFPIFLDHNTPTKGRDVSGNMAFHADAATEAGCLADFIAGSDIDIVSDLGALMIAVGQGRRGQRQCE
jgi:hypothetical protein